jgi:uncharacterized protein (TIGR02757 family)
MNITSVELKDFLDRKADQYNRPEFITSDPISIPHHFSRKEDIEISGFLTAAISWGTRTTIIQNASRLMRLLDDAPYQFVKESEPADLEVLRSFVHRTFNADDCIFFIQSLKKIYNNHGGLENVFNEMICQGYSIRDAIIYFRKRFLDFPHNVHVEKHIDDPSKNASAKRINMFLRWMVRTDNRGVDFGIWKSIPTALLFCPLDVHTGKVGRKLGLLNRTSNDWVSVEELTASLRKFDPVDPVKYDFALFGLGLYEKF